MRLNMIKSAALLLLLAVATCSHVAMGQVQDGPFGFYKGETMEQVIAAVGQSHVKEIKGDTLRLTTAPRPHPEFEIYSLIFSPTEGLLKITAIGVDIPNDADGTHSRAKFTRFKTSLIDTYGQPSDDFDFLQVGSIWSEPHDFMMGVRKAERNLDCYWKPAGHVHGISIVALNLGATTSSTGYINISYEFLGWEAYVDAKKNNQDKVF